MPKLVFRVGLGVSGYPDRPTKRQAEDFVASNGVCVSGQYFDLKPWSEEQGIDIAYVNQIDVTEHDDGTLVAYLNRYELLSDEEYAAALAQVGTEGQVSRLRVYRDEYPMVHAFIEHHPVTSIQLLLDQLVPECLISEKEPV